MPTPTNPFEDQAPLFGAGAPPVSTATPQDEETNIYGQPLFDKSGAPLNPTAPSQGEDQAPAPTRDTRSRRDLSQTYETPDPDNAPTVLQTDATVFGEQLGKGTDPGDQGGFAYGGRSTRNQQDYIALPPEWAKVVPPGYAMPIWNPNNPDKVVWGVHRDKGPADWRQDEGVGIDVAPSVAQQLGIKGKGTVQFDPTKARPLTQEEMQGRLAQETQDPSRLTASSESGGAMPPLPKEGTIKRYKDGRLVYPNGATEYPTGIIEIDAGSTRTTWIPDNTSPNGYKIHTANIKTGEELSPDMGKEAREAGIPLYDEKTGKKRRPVEIQQNLHDYYVNNSIPPPTIRKEAESIIKTQTSSRNPYAKQYLAIQPNYDTIKRIAEEPNRTGADDVALLQAVANIEAPGRSSTGHDMQQWMKARGLAGELEVWKKRGGAVWDFLNSKMTPEDWAKGGQQLPDELVQQIRRVADRSVEPRYQQYYEGLKPTINRIRKLLEPYGGKLNDYLPELRNPVTGKSPFDEEGEAPKTGAQPSGTPVKLTPEEAVAKAQEILADPNSPPDKRDLATKVLTKAGQ